MPHWIEPVNLVNLVYSLSNFPVKAKSFKELFRDPLISIERTDLAQFKIEKQARNNAVQITFTFKLQEYSSNLKTLL